MQLLLALKRCSLLGYRVHAVEYWLSQSGWNTSNRIFHPVAQQQVQVDRLNEQPGIYPTLRSSELALPEGYPTAPLPPLHRRSPPPPIRYKLYTYSATLSILRYKKHIPGNEKKSSHM